MLTKAIFMKNKMKFRLKPQPRMSPDYGPMKVPVSGNQGQMYGIKRGYGLMNDSDKTKL